MADELTWTPTRAAQEQNKIGWGDFLEGRIRRSWGAAQQVHCSARHEHTTNDKEKQEAEKHTGKCFRLCAVHEMWKFFETLWDNTNDDCHELDINKETPSLRMQRMKNRAHELCQEKRRLSTSDQKIFPDSIEEVLR